MIDVQTLQGIRFAKHEGDRFYSLGDIQRAGGPRLYDDRLDSVQESQVKDHRHVIDGGDPFEGMTLYGLWRCYQMGIGTPDQLKILLSLINDFETLERFDGLRSSQPLTHAADRYMQDPLVLDACSVHYTDRPVLTTDALAIIGVKVEELLEAVACAPHTEGIKYDLSSGVVHIPWPEHKDTYIKILGRLRSAMGSRGRGGDFVALKRLVYARAYERLDVIITRLKDDAINIVTARCDGRSVLDVSAELKERAKTTPELMAQAVSANASPDEVSAACAALAEKTEIETLRETVARLEGQVRELRGEVDHIHGVLHTVAEALSGQGR